MVLVNEMRKDHDGGGQADRYVTMFHNKPWCSIYETSEYDDILGPRYSIVFTARRVWTAKSVLHVYSIYYYYYYYSKMSFPSDVVLGSTLWSLALDFLPQNSYRQLTGK